MYSIAHVDRINWHMGILEIYKIVIFSFRVLFYESHVGWVTGL